MPCFAHRSRKLADDVALGVQLVRLEAGAGIGRGAGPQREALVMLAGQHHVARAGIWKIAAISSGFHFFDSRLKMGAKS